MAFELQSTFIPVIYDGAARAANRNFATDTQDLFVIARYDGAAKQAAITAASEFKPALIPAIYDGLAGSGTAGISFTKAALFKHAIYDGKASHRGVLVSSSTKEIKQFLQPDATVSAGSWVSSIQTLDLHNFVNEEAANDSRSIFSPQSPTNDACRIGLEAVAAPSAAGDHVLRYRIKNDNPDGSVLQLIIRILSGGVTVAEWTENLEQVSNFTTIARALSIAQIGNLNYADIDVQLEANTIDNTSPAAQVSWINLEMPL